MNIADRPRMRQPSPYTTKLTHYSRKVGPMDAGSRSQSPSSHGFACSPTPPSFFPTPPASLLSSASYLSPFPFLLLSHSAPVTLPFSGDGLEYLSRETRGKARCVGKKQVMWAGQEMGRWCRKQVMRVGKQITGAGNWL